MTWRATELTRRLGIRLPIVQAPMAGGWTTPPLVAEVSEAGGLGSVAGAMLQPGDLREMIRAVRSLTDRPFAVNLFAPLPAPSSRGVEEWSRLTGVPVPDAPAPPPRVDDQLAVVVEERVPVFSFTFGVPPLDGLEAFTIGTATTVEEAVALQDAGVQAVVAQGYEAGGHRGTFLAPVAESLVGTLALVPQVVDAVSMPVIASGGLMDGRGIAAARALGADGVQLGSAFLRTDEAGTGAAYREALGRDTTVTHVLTGRPCPDGPHRSRRPARAVGRRAAGLPVAATVQHRAADAGRPGRVDGPFGARAGPDGHARARDLRRRRRV